MKKFLKWFLVGMLVVAVYLLLAPQVLVWSQQDDLYVSLEEVPDGYEVAVVFGAGLRRDGLPSDVLRDRLRSAAELYDAGKVQKILVSGDNRFENYNEPEAMKEYLVNSLGVGESDVVEDFAGRRTYDTCARASEIWQLKSAILVTQEYHLSRAMFICESFGIENVGYSASKQTYVAQDWMSFREWIARNWAVWDVYILKPDYLGGEVENDFLQ